ncbi:MAG: hypothetical protein ABIH24_07865 [Verrucomicrobiota bacterium]
MKFMNPAIDFYETVADKTVIRACDFYGTDTCKHYRHCDSIHSFTTAFGVPQPRLCCFCHATVGARFSLAAIAAASSGKGRYLLKLVAAWRNWRAYVHPARIILNGHDILNGPLFLENVCKGWPGLYFDVPPEYLAEKNTLAIVNRSGGANVLLVERVEVLRLKAAEDFSVWYCPDFVQNKTRFVIKLMLLKDYPDITVKYPEDKIELLERRGRDFIFKSRHASRNIKIIFKSGKNKCAAVIGDVYARPAGREVFVGMDCDDYRQDESQELDRILAHFAYTQMGNFIAFRPKPNRNYPAKYPAPPLNWRRWMDFCKANKIKFQFSGLPAMPAGASTALKKEIVQRGGRDFAGFQIHEPYCMSFSPVLQNPPAIKRAKDFVEKKRAYLEFVNARIDEIKYGNAKMFCGDPSLLCVYLRESKIDNILCEPVSNSALLFGAARGTGKDFGAHLAPDWYVGFPHDRPAIDRMALLLDLIYAYGGKHIYLESTAFKTNAFARNDWEDAFCRAVREKLRGFYRFTCRDARIGNPEVPLAFVYGNLESMFWRPDDRIPELADSGNWDDTVWGKWPNTQYRWLWQATDAWLPPLDFEMFGKNESLTKMFCGSPYGQVDVISPYVDLSRYKAIAFLGWNTMDECIYRNLLAYVRGGGILFICGCHFDTRVDFKGQPRFIRAGKVSGLIGADIAGAGSKVFDKFHTCRLENITARQTQEFLFEHAAGKGRVYFLNFYDYPHDQRLVKIIRIILENIGRQQSRGDPVHIEGINKKYINYTVWRDGRRRKMYLVNIDWQNAPGKKIVVCNKTKKMPLTIPGGRMLVLDLGM